MLLVSFLGKVKCTVFSSEPVVPHIFMNWAFNSTIFGHMSSISLWEIEITITCAANQAYHSKKSSVMKGMTKCQRVIPPFH